MLISVCIPTYNRSAKLAKLLENLSSVIPLVNSNIEVCISNNASTDESDLLIKEFIPDFTIRYVTQTKNIGSSLNVIEVVRLSEGEFIFLVGDDDAIIIDGLNSFIHQAGEANWHGWCFVNTIKGHDGFAKQLVHDYPYKVMSAQQAMFFLITHGTANLGFIGAHVLPGKVRGLLTKLPARNIDYIGWPHLLLFYDYLSQQESGLLCLDTPVVIQSADGAPAQFWPAPEYFFMELTKYLLPSRSDLSKTHRLISLLIMARHLYSSQCYAFMFSWKMRDPTDFDKYSIRKVIKFISDYPRSVQIISFTCVLSIIILTLFPEPLLRHVLPGKLIRKIKALDENQKQMNPRDSGVERVL